MFKTDLIRAKLIPVTPAVVTLFVGSSDTDKVIFIDLSADTDVQDFCIIASYTYTHTILLLVKYRL